MKTTFGSAPCPLNGNPLVELATGFNQLQPVFPWSTSPSEFGATATATESNPEGLQLEVWLQSVAVWLSCSLFAVLATRLSNTIPLSLLPYKNLSQNVEPDRCASGMLR
jgi:hypothetical protein